MLAVVLTHVHDTLRALIGDPYKPFEFFSYHGWLAVEFFFLLSGFTLTHAYGERLGQRLDLRSYSSFLWRRIARLWPVFALTLILTMIMMGAAAALRLEMPKARIALDPGFFFQQLSMTWMWFRDDVDVPASWNGPSWYVSVEFLACVLFPFVLLLVHRLARVVRTPWLVALLVLTLTPYAVIEFYYSTGPTPYSSMLRVATFFGGGMLLRALLSRVTWHRDEEGLRGARSRTRRALAGAPPWWIDLLAPVAILALLATMWVDYHLLPNREIVYVVVPLAFCMIVAGLALGRGGLSRACAARPVVALGQISYGIFLGHGFLLIVREYLLESGTVSASSSYVVIAVALGAYFAGSLAIGWLLWRYVEEPASRALSAMIAPGAEDSAARRAAPRSTTG